MLSKFKQEHPNVYLLCISVFFAFVLVSFSSVLTSFVFPLIPNIGLYNDASMFYIMGRSMAQGLTPYIEIYDHKGLYIFFYTAISGFLGKPGVFVIQVILMSVVFAFIYKSIKLVNEKEEFAIIAMIIFLITFSFASQTPGDADLELPFNAGMIYFYLKGIKKNSYKYFMFGNIFLGISTGIALNLRVSDSLLPLAVVIYFFVRCLLDKKNFKYLIRDAGIILGLIVLMSIPVFLYAYLGNFIPEMIDAVYLSNFKYLIGQHKESAFKYIVRIILPILYALVTLGVYIKRKELTKDEKLFILISMGVSFLIQFILAKFPHYLIILFPYLSVVCTWILSFFLKRDLFKNISLYSSITVGAISLWFNPIMMISNYEITQNNVNYINETISKEDKNGHTLVFGFPSLYIDTNIFIGYGDFSSQKNHVSISERFSNEALKEYLTSAESKYIIVNSDYKNFVFEHIEDVNSYELVQYDKPTSIEIYFHKI